MLFREVEEKIKDHSSQLEHNTQQIDILKPKIDSLASGSPKGVYSTLTDLQTAFPSGNTNIYVVTADGNWYYWNGTSWIAGGIYQGTKLDNSSVKTENIDKEVYTTLIGTRLYSTRSGTFEKASAIKFYYTIPSTLIKTVKVKYKATSLSDNTNTLATKVAVNGITNNLKVSSYDSFENGTSIAKSDTFSYDITATDITVYVWVVSKDETLPIEYYSTDIELYINDNLISAMPTKDTYNIMNYGSLSDYEITPLLAPMTVVNNAILDINDLKDNINNINGETQVKFNGDSLTEEYILGTNHSSVSTFWYSNNNLYSFDIKITKITFKANATTTGNKQIEIAVVDSDLNIISDNLYDFAVNSVGINDVSIDVDISLPANYRIAFLKKGDAAICYQNGLTGYSINGYTKSNNKLVLSQQNIKGALSYNIDYVKITKLSEILNDYAKKTEIPQVPQVPTNRLSGKKIVAIGDSMVQGHSIPKDQGWLAMIANRNNMTYVNYGVNGTYLSNKLYGENKGAVERYTSMDNDADYIVVFAGTNDAANGVTIGDDSSVDISTFKGALNVLCDGLLTKYPKGKIMFITPYLRTANYINYINAIETICAKYGIRVFNNMKNGGICWSNSAQVQALTLNDTYHLNLEGMEYASYKYEAELKMM